ncbi:hypothetical protein N7462_000599 [Penicillium macrosclerotiorum]|uniref:uncharacterized protein n=1 Tax=Penicillium macrosclerotiorum TaxID=303699 RepID=UPI00254706CD|nr:uncharacterized protein N7462_000599 [Penicillium macrosclerotiorum]KAJ5698594.1 hypothetical protein N7462_000599 [Penicillium macrosclerotiorum]
MDPYPPPSSMALSPQSPSAGSHSSIFRPRRSEDWHDFREIIEQLYRNDQLKLRDVKRIMEKDYNFYASEKQYKDRLAAWHVRKNIKAKEVQLMIRKQEKRAARGKQTAFRVNGQQVDPKRIARFVRRYGTTWDQGKESERPSPRASPEPSTPSDMTCYTPEPEEHSAATPVSPSDMHSPTRETSAYPLTYGMYQLLTPIEISHEGAVKKSRSVKMLMVIPDSNQIDNIPDLVMDDDQPSYPMGMHSNPPPRRTYHPPEHLMHAHPVTHSGHPASPVATAGPPAAPGPSQVSQVSQVSPVSRVSPASPAPGPPAIPVSNLHPQDARHPANTSAQMVHGPEWNRLDTFQTRLENLQYTLNQSMSKWAREQDPNQEITHHEGLGM